MKANTKKFETFLSKDTIREIYKCHCEEKEIPFNDNQFEDFLNFLAIDISDWVNGSLRYFDPYEYGKRHEKEQQR